MITTLSRRCLAYPSICTFMAVAFAIRQSSGDQAATALDRPIQVDSGQTTIGEFTRQLTEKSGMQVECAAYLRNRVVTVFLPATTLRKALDAVAEVNEWRWTQEDFGKVLISRRPTPRPRTVPEAFAVARSVFPADWRRFLTHPPAGLQPGPHDEIHRRMGVYESSVVYPIVRKRLTAIVQRYADALLKSVGNGSIETKGLSPKDREDLLNCLVFEALSHFYDTSQGFMAICGLLRPYQSDLNSARILVKDLSISVEVREERDGMMRGSGFGAPLFP